MFHLLLLSGGVLDDLHGGREGCVGLVFSLFFSSAVRSSSSSLWKKSHSHLNGLNKTATLEPTGIYHSWLLTLGTFLIKHAPTQEVLLHRYVVYYTKICVRCCTRQKENAFLRIVWYVVLLQCWNAETLPSYARIFPKWLMVHCRTSSVLSWCGGPSSTLLRPSRLRCLLLGFLALVLSPLPWLRRRTGLVSHFFNVFPVVPERLGPGEPVGKDVTDVWGCSDAEDSDLTSELPTG